MMKKSQSESSISVSLVPSQKHRIYASSGAGSYISVNSTRLLLHGNHYDSLATTCIPQLLSRKLMSVDGNRHL